MFDNNAGNTMGMEGVHNSCRLFHTLHAPYFKVIGNDNATNRYYLAQAIERMKDKPRGNWCLVQAYN